MRDRALRRLQEKRRNPVENFVDSRNLSVRDTPVAGRLASPANQDKCQGNRILSKSLSTIVVDCVRRGTPTPRTVTGAMLHNGEAKGLGNSNLHTWHAPSHADTLITAEGESHIGITALTTSGRPEGTPAHKAAH